ncbi:endo-1,4-beta-xylanase [Symbioplanes lichenis]|uniref:endo-1,4-beta-xylanase n=1 Tax=Symbioplanes lichenis TaxID=1629072 RepID=UPI00273965A7|nr:endo-1,4-beta-xylanase [Actinoplanes lichenis]
MRLPALIAIAALAGTLVAAPAAAATSLAQLATAKGVDIGVALDPNRLGEAAYKTIADTEFNLVVPENAMKWDATEPTQGQFTFTAGDTVAAYAAQTGKELYGHTLVWHSQLPNWVSGLDATALRTAMLNHVTTVATHFKGKVGSWDVVNEAFSDNGDGSRRSSVFQTKLGDGYIADAFRAARAADPGAKLCINDYSIENIGAKSTAIYNLVRDFKAQGVPIDCVGFQAHLILGQVPGDMRANLQRFADLGVDVRVTELDIRMATPPDATKLAQQASDYRAVVTNCLAVTRCQGVTVWGVTDKYSWIPGVFPGQGAALLWDDNYAAKPAYQAVAEALGGTTTPPAPAGCEVTYSVASQWNNGFTAAITITNTGSTAWSGWTLGFAFAAGQTVGQAWNATSTQSGSAVTLRNASYNATVAPGGAVSLGFNGTHTGSNPAPAAFTANGTACA